MVGHWNHQPRPGGAGVNSDLAMDFVNWRNISLAIDLLLVSLACWIIIKLLNTIL